jgi:peptide/nickel transport system ATP-binding protein
MYRGEIVESGPTAEVLRTPRHPYTRALLDAVPSVTQPRRLVGIPGRPPHGVAPGGCGFADRCTFVESRCRTEPIALVAIEGVRQVRCRRHAEISLTAADSQLTLTQADGSGEPPVLEVNHVVCRYSGAHPVVVNDVSLRLAQGEALGLVGESGSGKSTLLRAIAGSHPPVSGEVRLNGDPLPGQARRRSRGAKRDIQLIFQNPDTSLNPSHTVGEILRRPLRVFRDDLERSGEDQEITALLESVLSGRAVGWPEAACGHRAGLCGTAGSVAVR